MIIPQPQKIKRKLAIKQAAKAPTVYSDLKQANS